MMRIGLGALGVIAVTSLGLWMASSAGGEGARQPEAVDIQAGERLYAENCASCHGANLEGQPDWRRPGPGGRLPAPPHDETGHTWHHGDAMLFDYTRLGGQAALAESGVEGYDSGMPAFGETLSDQEIWNILAYIKSTWPDRIRGVQAERSAMQ